MVMVVGQMECLRCVHPFSVKDCGEMRKALSSVWSSFDKKPNYCIEILCIEYRLNSLFTLF